MARSSLEEAMASLSSIWGPLTTELVDASRFYLEALAKAPREERWLADLHRDRPVSRELYRDPVHGFVLLAHAEQAGLYRPPHDHGRSWVIYAVQSGESEMGDYVPISSPDGRARLVKRGATVVKAGVARVYLPGDIHDTLCVSGPAILLRFTERDLKTEDQVAGRVTRYVQRDGFWTVAER